jgi:WD40 repeat protein/serine/threonine protein kinase
MTRCPEGEQLARLLAEQMSPPEQDALARHVEGCASCQEKLARLTSRSDTASWQRGAHPPPGMPAEDDVVRRLKHALPAAAWARLETAAAPSVPDRPSVPGYEILDTLGRGGMGVVYRARQLSLDRIVALKMILAGPHCGPRDLARFRGEAAAVARLQHPNIVQVYDVGEADGRPYLALEFVPGGSLAQHLDGSSQPIGAAARLVETLARAVQVAHEHGIIHRDLKPANVLLSLSRQAPVSAAGEARGGVSRFNEAVPKITDFGLAKLADGEGAGGPTVSGEVVGTPSYMAPEQAATPRQPAGPAADVYALGAILYELLTGRPPFKGETPLHTVLQVLHDEPVSVTRLRPNVPRDLETICHKCLQKDPRKRYASAVALAEDLRRFLSGEPVIARPPSALYRWGKFAQRHKALVGGVAGVLLAITLGAITAGLFAVRATEQRDRAEGHARRADQERDAALRQAYRAHLAAAGAALRDHDVAAASHHLEAAPDAWRDWEWYHLNSRLDDSSAVVRASGQGTMLLASCAQGIRLVAVGPDDLRLLDPDRGERLILPRKSLSRVHHVEHAPRGTRVFAQDESGQLVVLDETGTVRLRLAPPGVLGPDALAVSPDQARLALAWGQDDPSYTFALYDLASAEKRAVFVGHTDRIHALAFSPDGRQVASASEDHTARLWDAATGALRRELRGHTDKVWAVAYAPDGARVVTASADGTTRQWDVVTGRPFAVPYRGHSHEVLTAVYSPDGRRIASAGRDRTVRLWAADDQEDVAVLHGHTEAVVLLAFDADGRRLASAARDRTGRVWEVGGESSPSVLRGHTRYVYPVAYSPDGRWIASGGWDSKVRLWDAFTGQPGAVLPHANRVRALAFSPDSTWLVSGCDDEDRLTIWDLGTGRRRNRIPGPGKRLGALAVSPDGARIAAQDLDGTLRLAEAAGGREVATARLPGAGLRTELAYSPDGRWLALIADRSTVGLWDAQTHQLVAQWAGHTGGIYTVAFSRDGRRLVSAGEDRTVRLWDVATGAPLAVLRGHSEAVFTAAFHPGGNRVASAGGERAILLWDVATGAEVARLQGHTDYIFSLAFSPDGATLASGSGDFTVRLWDTAPLAQRLTARQEAEALRPDAEQRVERLFREVKDPSEMVRTLQADQALSAPLRQEVQRAIWRRLAAPAAPQE